MRMLGLAVVTSAVVVVAASQGTLAAGIDMSKLTCKAFLQTKDAAGVNLMWMNGYFAAKAGDTVFDTDRHIKAARELGYQCRNNPDAFLIEIYRRALTDSSGTL